MTRCEWAGCPLPASSFEGEWWHCKGHLNEHRLLMAEEEGRDRQRNGKPAAVCGTTSGYRKHLKLGEATCEPCRKANRRDVEQRRRITPVSDRAALIRAMHATGATDEQIGAALVVSTRHAALLRFDLGLPSNGRTSPRDLMPCGTSAAYRRHLRAGERPCLSCQQAESRRRPESQKRSA